MESMPELLVILACFALSAFFSGSETALLRLRETDVEREAESGGGPSAPAIRELLRSTSRLLVTILLGNNVVNLLAASVASALAVAALGEQAGVLVATLVLTLIVLVFCEVLPKAVAARNPERFAHAIALPLYLAHQGLRPVHIAYDRWLEPVVRRISGGAASDESMPPEEVLRIAMRAGKGQPQGTPLAIIAAAADAVDTQVHEIMVPSSEIVAYQINTPPAQLLEEFLEERYTRAPLYKESIDRFEGVVHLKDLVKLVRDGGTDLRGILKPVLRVPEGKRILDLLTEMQRAFVQLAVVKDEFGNTEGIVTQEDILEELVGEIRDEFDSEELETIRPSGDNAHQAMGRLHVVDFNRQTGWDVPAGRGETLAGLIFNVLGRAPRKGDVAHVAGYDLGVIDVSGTRITRVLVRKRADSTGEEPDPETRPPRASARS
jgi:CBS domain containing-hemolysin-like protein